jgi:hypothetical protein
MIPPTPPPFLLPATPWLKIDAFTEKEYYLIHKKCHRGCPRSCMYANLFLVFCRRIMKKDRNRKILLRSIELRGDGYLYWTERISGTSILTGKTGPIKQRFRIYLNKHAQQYINRFDRKGKTALITRQYPFAGTVEPLGEMPEVNAKTAAKTRTRSAQYRRDRKAGKVGPGTGRSNVRSLRGSLPELTYAEIQAQLLVQAELSKADAA